MKSIFKLSIKLLIISICFAFTGVENDGLNVTYGVSENDPSQIELSLKDDYTFSYQDFSINSQEIKVSGTYQMKNNTIYLIPKEKNIEFHDKWKLSKDYKTAKARKGLLFYKLQIKEN